MTAVSWSITDPTVTATLWPDNADDAAIALNGALMQNGLVITVAPGAEAPNTAAPIDARPVGAVDKGHGEAVSASHHG